MKVADLDAEILSPRDVIVIRSPDNGEEWWDEDANLFLSALASRTGCHVVVLTPGSEIESLTESQMREKGWVRVRQFDRLVDARARLRAIEPFRTGGSNAEFVEVAVEVLDEIELAR